MLLLPPRVLWAAAGWLAVRTSVTASAAAATCRVPKKKEKTHAQQFFDAPRRAPELPETLLRALEPLAWAPQLSGAIAANTGLCGRRPLADRVQGDSGQPSGTESPPLSADCWLLCAGQSWGC